MTPPQLAGDVDVRLPMFLQHDELVPTAGRVGPVDRWPVEKILELLPSLPVWPAAGHSDRIKRIAGARRVLEWLSLHPGAGWQDRWLVSGADDGLAWIDQITPDDPRTASTQRDEALSGLCCLLLCRVVLPSYQFLANYRAYSLFDYTRQTLRPDLFAQVEENASKIGVQGRQLFAGLRIISKLVLHTGRDVDQLTAEDLFSIRAWSMRTYNRGTNGIQMAWVLLRGIADLGEHRTLRDALRFGQRPTAELVDRYRVQCEPVREVLIRYLDERRPGMDYGSFRGLVGQLAGTFWADIERHHPGIDTLHLPDEVAEAWKQRLAFTTKKGAEGRERKGRLDVLMRVRSFYLDIQEWALEDASWAAWAVPCPVRRGDTDGMAKLKKLTTAAMHERIRERLPHLPALVDIVEAHRADQAALLEAATAAPVGQTFEHDGRPFRRTTFKSHSRGPSQAGPAPVLAEETATRELIDLTRSEDEAFWAWAIVEVLRHTGVRVEELLEITHLALVSYRLPDTGEVVPMLQIVPSKSNEERLLLVSPELASVLATIITRLRHQNGGSIPLVSRYDPHERTSGPVLPHLFQRKHGWRSEVISYRTVQKLINRTLARAGIRDVAGQPLTYTPHDFRRMFATEAVTGGLPVHIAARLLGHAHLGTTQAYLAVFHDDLVRTYRAFLDKRRAARPEAEYREPTDEEWREFHQHFQLRKLELGECGRPYGTPCKHEHACIRCPSLRLDPKARSRLIEIIANLKDRIQEAKLNGWLGEVQGLETSLNEAAKKLVSLDRSMQRSRGTNGPRELGIPVIPSTGNRIS